MFALGYGRRRRHSREKGVVFGEFGVFFFGGGGGFTTHSSYVLGEQRRRYPRPLCSVFTSITHSISPLNSTLPPPPQRQPLAPHTTLHKSHLPLFSGTPSISPLCRTLPFKPFSSPSSSNFAKNLEGKQEHSGQTKVTVFPYFNRKHIFFTPTATHRRSSIRPAVSFPLSLSLSLSPLSLSLSLYSLSLPLSLSLSPPLSLSLSLPLSPSLSLSLPLALSLSSSLPFYE